jgi:hypothetical protein
MTTWWRAGSFAPVMIGAPFASLLVLASQVKYRPISGPMKLAGSPAMTPSKSSGYRCASSSPSRPPVEQPLK